MNEECVQMDEFAVYLSSLYWEQAIDDLSAELIAYEYVRFKGGDADELLNVGDDAEQTLREAS